VGLALEEKQRTRKPKPKSPRKTAKSRPGKR
jgi:hypothetical protein